MKLLVSMLMVLVIEYTFGAEVQQNITGGNEMKLGLVNYMILPDKLGSLDDLKTEVELSATDMLATISVLDKYYDYKIYKSFDTQFIVTASLKGDSDTLLDMTYMSLGDIKAWYKDKLDEHLNREEMI